MTDAKNAANHPTKAIPPRKASAPTKRRFDWEAVERDYRTGSMTLRELEVKHGPNNATILRRARRHGWQRDLSAAVRQATNARLIEETLQQARSAAQQGTASAVLTAAEVNARIVMSHRKRAADALQLADRARAKLLALDPADIREVAIYVQSVNTLATATRTLVEVQRKAFDMDTEAPLQPPIRELTDAQLMARAQQLLTGATPWLTIQ